MDFAVNEARQALSAGDRLHDRDWSTPVLYMGTRNGRILDLVSPPADEAEAAWQSLAVAVQDSESAAKSLSDLSAAFGQIAARQRGLADLLALEERLAAVRAAFEPCRVAVEQAGDWQGLPGARLNRLRQAWLKLRQGPWPGLQAFLAERPALAGCDFVQPLGPPAESVQSSLDKMRLADLAAHVLALAAALDQAAAASREERERALAELVSLSDKTLGRFEVT